jgi:hypothetical protein
MSDHGAHQRHLSGGDFQFHDDLASLFAPRPGEYGTPMMQQPWFADYLHASTPAPLDYYNSFAGEFDDMPPAVEEVKTELPVDTGAASAGVLGMPGGGGATPLTPNSLSLSSTSSEACGAAAGEEAAGKYKKEEEGGESKEGSAAKGDGHMDDKDKKG